MSQAMRLKHPSLSCTVTKDRTPSIPVLSYRSISDDHIAFPAMTNAIQHTKFLLQVLDDHVFCHACLHGCDRQDDSLNNGCPINPKHILVYSGIC